MTLPPGGARAVSFDLGQVLVALDFRELARRLHHGDLSGEHDSPIGASRVTDRSVTHPPAILELAAQLESRLAEAVRAHELAVAGGLGHEGGWRAYVRVLVTASQRVEDDATDAAVSTLWAAQPARNLWRAVPDEARALLDSLTAARVPMVLTSNSEGRARELVRDVGLLHHFMGVLDSGVTGIAKPDPRVFRNAAAIVQVPVAELVHVGDSESADVAGALAASALAIRFDRFIPGAEHHPTRAHARAANFTQLRDQLALVLHKSLQ